MTKQLAMGAVLGVLVATQPLSAVTLIALVASSVLVAVAIRL
jgi:hypothetical protein